jgi:hypothetical protein
MTVMDVGHRKISSPPLSPAVGGDLPEDRRAAVEYGLAQYQMLAAERDSLVRENSELRNALAEHRASLEVHHSRIADMDSRIATATMVRDQAVADRAKYETMFISIFAQLRAFEVPAAPLVREAPPAQTDEEHQ